MIKSYKDLDIWQRSMALVKKVYLSTKEFPNTEIYGLTSQMRRSAISIPSNIAEGKTRHHINEYVQFLYVALSSCAELETQIIISSELGYLGSKTMAEILEEIDHLSRMMRNLIKRLR